MARVWITFLILAFSSASLNSLVGFETDWFKATWATLATFGFATMAWIFHLGFLIPAVQMSLTALLIARHPGLGLPDLRRLVVPGPERGGAGPGASAGPGPDRSGSPSDRPRGPSSRPVEVG